MHDGGREGANPVKRYTSSVLKSVAFAYCAFPAVLFPVFVVVFDIAWVQVFRLLISPLFYFVTGWMVLAGYGLWEMRRWSWYVFLTANTLLLYWCALVLTEFGQTQHKGMSFSLVFSVVVVLLIRVGREVRVPYFHPRIRWWETNPRYRLSVQVQVERQAGVSESGEILDISRGGCFVKFRETIQDHERVLLRFTIFQIPMCCEGVVVWRSRSTVTHPKGCGVKFVGMTKVQRKSFRFIESRLRRISSLYRSSRFLMDPQEFSKRMDELQREPLRAAEKDRK